MLADLQLWARLMQPPPYPDLSGEQLVYFRNKSFNVPNAGEAIGVFGILDWQVKDPGFSLSAYISGQKKKNKIIKFYSSIDLHRLESHLKKLKSPQWPDFFPEIDSARVNRGELLYEKYCISCHVVIERDIRRFFI